MFWSLFLALIFCRSAALDTRICNDLWLDYADLFFQCQPPNSSNCALYTATRSADRPTRNVPVVHVPQDQLRQFEPFVPSSPFVLVSSNNFARCAPYVQGKPRITAVMQSPYLVHWFSTHLGLEASVLSPLPLGVKVQWKSVNFHGEEASKRQLDQMLANNDPARNFADRERTRLIDLSLSTWTGDKPWCETTPSSETRRRAHAHLQTLGKEHSVIDGRCAATQSWPSTSGLDSNHRLQNNFFRRLRCARFVPAPAGFAPDTHRVYEALAMGAIPIVLDFAPLRPLWRRLPVLVVARWTDVTRPMLEREYERMHARSAEFDWSLLTPAPWLAMIDAAANSTTFDAWTTRDVRRWTLSPTPPPSPPTTTTIEHVLPLGRARSSSAVVQALQRRPKEMQQQRATSMQNQAAQSKPTASIAVQNTQSVLFELPRLTDFLFVVGSVPRAMFFMCCGLACYCTMLTVCLLFHGAPPRRNEHLL